MGSRDCGHDALGHGTGRGPRRLAAGRAAGDDGRPHRSPAPPGPGHHRDHLGDPGHVPPTAHRGRTGLPRAGRLRAGLRGAPAARGLVRRPLRGPARAEVGAGRLRAQRRGGHHGRRRRAGHRPADPSGGVRGTGRPRDPGAPDRPAPATGAARPGLVRRRGGDRPRAGGRPGNAADRGGGVEGGIHRPRRHRARPPDRDRPAGTGENGRGTAVGGGGRAPSRAPERSGDRPARRGRGGPARQELVDAPRGAGGGLPSCWRSCAPTPAGRARSSRPP